MKAIIKSGAVEFYDDNKLFGVYHYNDPFKSFFNPLLTPSSKNVVAMPPPDHPHHKGLQFGLCATTGNFWEESKSSEGPDHQYPIGRQRTIDLRLLGPDSGIGFQQDICWEVDGVVLFQELREISVSKENTAYKWLWHTRLTALKNVQLVKTVWDDSPGYYGVGLRLAENYFKKGKTIPPNLKNGNTPSITTYQGDGVAVTFEQNPVQANSLFISTYQQPPGFSFMSLGPTNNVETLSITQGQTLDCNYEATVSDSF